MTYLFTWVVHVGVGKSFVQKYNIQMVVRLTTFVVERTDCICQIECTFWDDDKNEKGKIKTKKTLKVVQNPFTNKGYTHESGDPFSTYDFIKMKLLIENGLQVFLLKPGTIRFFNISFHCCSYIIFLIPIIKFLQSLQFLFPVKGKYIEEVKIK